MVQHYRKREISGAPLFWRMGEVCFAKRAGPLIMVIRVYEIYCTSILYEILWVLFMGLYYYTRLPQVYYGYKLYTIILECHVIVYSYTNTIFSSVIILVYYKKLLYSSNNHMGTCISSISYEILYSSKNHN